MKGDYYRYLAEVATGDARSGMKENLQTDQTKYCNISYVESCSEKSRLPATFFFSFLHKMLLWRRHDIWPGFLTRAFIDTFFSQSREKKEEQESNDHRDVLSQLLRGDPRSCSCCCIFGKEAWTVQQQQQLSFLSLSLSLSIENDCG